MTDITHCSSTEPAGPRYTTQVSFQEGYSGALYSYICTGSHCYAYLSLSKSRGIINAIAGHSYHTTLCLKALYYLAFLLRQHISLNFINT